MGGFVGGNLSFIGDGVPSPQVPNMQEVAAKGLQLRNLAQQGQMQTMELQQRSMDLQDQKIMRDAYMQSGGDMDKYQQLLMQGGASGKAIQSSMLQRLTMQKEIGALDEQKQKIFKGKNDAYGSVSASLLQIPDPNQRQQYWQQTGIPTLTAAGYKQSELPPNLPADPDQQSQFLQLHANQAKSADQIFQEVMKGKEDTRATALAEPQLAEARDKALLSGQDVAARTVGQIGNQDDYTAWRNGLRPEVQKTIPPMYSPAAVQMVQRTAVPVKDQPEYDLTRLKADNGIVGTDKFETVFLPAYAKNLGKTVAQLTPQEKMASFSVFKQYDTNPEVLQSLLESRRMTQVMHEATLNNQQFQRGQQSYQFHAGELDRAAKPVGEMVQRLGRLQDTLAAGSPQADALVAPELLSVMAGGQGSGLRMNEAEISRIVGGRSKWETLKASINQWQLDPTKANSITPEQRQEIRALTGAVGQKIKDKQSLIDSARSSLAGSNDPMEHRRILSNVNQQLTGIDAGSGSNGAASAIPPAVKTALQSAGPGVHTLSDGSTWMKDNQGNITRR
jgi:hypothetical protein